MTSAFPSSSSSVDLSLEDKVNDEVNNRVDSSSSKAQAAAPGKAQPNPRPRPVSRFCASIFFSSLSIEKVILFLASEDSTSASPGAAVTSTLGISENDFPTDADTEEGDGDLGGSNVLPEQSKTQHSSLESSLVMTFVLFQT